MKYIIILKYNYYNFLIKKKIKKNNIIKIIKVFKKFNKNFKFMGNE